MLTQQSNVYTSKPLTNVSLAYHNEGYICDKIAPNVIVKQDTGKIYSYGMDSLRIVNTYRGTGGRSNIVETTVSSADHYDLEDHALGEFIPQEVYDNEEAPINARVDVTEALTERILVDKEKALADVITATGTYSNYETLSGNDQWNDYDNSDPVEAIKDSISTVRSACGKTPNSLIVAWDTMNALTYHPVIRKYFPGATAITFKMLRDALPTIFNLKNLIVGDAQYNNSNKGGTDTLTDIWTDFALVAYIEPKPTKKSRTFMFNYTRKVGRNVEYLPQGKGGLETMDRKSDYVRVSDKYDLVLLDETCAYLFDDTLA